MLWPLQNPLLSLLTFFVGLLVGHRMALWRDMRKEFNDAADPVRAWLLLEVSGPSAYRKPPTGLEVDRFVQCLSRWNRKSFLAAWERQKAERDKEWEMGPLGHCTYKNKGPILDGLRECIQYTRCP